MKHIAMLYNRLNSDSAWTPLFITLIILSVAAGTLTGCATPGTKIGRIEPVCDALVGPIRYSSQNPKSPRYAANHLAPDLAVRNRVGQGLGCPQYRR